VPLRHLMNVRFDGLEAVETHIHTSTDSMRWGE